MDFTDQTISIEVRLCAICEHNLNAPVVHPDDDFRALGGDSIAVLSFLLDVQDRTQATVPIEQMMNVTTIRELAVLLKGAEITLPTSSHVAPKRMAKPTGILWIRGIANQGAKILRTFNQKRVSRN